MERLKFSQESGTYSGNCQFSVRVPTYWSIPYLYHTRNLPYSPSLLHCIRKQFPVHPPSEALCYLLSTPDDNLWNYALPNGADIQKGVDFLYGCRICGFRFFLRYKTGLVPQRTSPVFIPIYSPKPIGILAETGWLPAASWLELLRHLSIKILVLGANCNNWVGFVSKLDFQ